MTQIYTFKNDGDLAFYILNAVCHDWIHDFNNYKRMSKILNYIIELISQAASIAKRDRDNLTALAIQIDDNVKMLDQYDRGVASAKDTGAAIAEDTDVAQAKDTGAEIANAKDTGAEIANAKDTGAEIANAKDTGAEIANAKDTGAEIANAKDTGAEIADDEDNKLYYAQLDNYSIEEDIIEGDTSEELLTTEDIVLKSKILYTNLHNNTRASHRLNKARMLALQKLKDFTDETILLVMSKLDDGNMVRHGGSSTPQKGGASAIDIITKDDISSSINGIINEIDDTQDVSTEDKKNLKNIFELMNQVFLNVNIQGISELEILNNSLISEILSMFIVNKCESIDIDKEAIIYLDALGVSKLNDIKVPTKAPSKRIFMPPNRPLGMHHPGMHNAITFGGKINSKIYNDNTPKWDELEKFIVLIKTTPFYSIYKGEISVKTITTEELQTLYEIYLEYISPIIYILKLIVGDKMFDVKTKSIQEAYRRTTKGNTPRLNTKYIQETIDSINDLLFDNIIKEFEDVKNRNKLRFITNSSSSSDSSLSQAERSSVQQISKLIAIKTLLLTVHGKNYSNDDLSEQIKIIQNVADDKGYTSVDERLLSYFIEKYKPPPVKVSKGKASKTTETTPNHVVLIHNVANEFLLNSIETAENRNSRVINNAIPDGAIKQLITSKNLVVCPTSSVCDGMGSFGSCLSPPVARQEYYNMDFMITDRHNINFYEGTTNINEQKDEVAISYGIKYNELELYNFLTIDLSQPIVLQANYTFKHVINRIIEIWKSAGNVTNIKELWDMLYHTDYFLSILKLGSQKAIGDIFQEVNSTLYNCGYSDISSAKAKAKKPAKKPMIQDNPDAKTYGLMGDRPSGIRVFKLLLNGTVGSTMPFACGGFIGSDSMLIYVPKTLIKNEKKKGGNKTHRHNKKISRNNKAKHNKRTRRNRKTRKS